MADDGTLILVLYPLESVASVDDQKEKVDGESSWTGDGNHNGEVPEQLEPTIIYIDQELAFVLLQVSLWDFLHLIAVDNPKQDHGEVTKVYDNGFVQLQLIDEVGVECWSWSLLPLTVTQTPQMLPLNCLQHIDRGYSQVQQTMVGKEVAVWARNSPWWGHVGTAKTHNLILNTFQVAFPTALVILHVQELWLKWVQLQTIRYITNLFSPVT